MISRKFNGEVVNYPGSWDELNFFQYLQLSLGVSSDAEFVAIMTGLPIEKVEYSTDVVAFNDIVNSFGWYASPPEFNKPESLTIDGKKINLPKDIGNHSVRQFEQLKAIIAELYVDGEPNHNQVIQKYPMMCAIYLQPLLDGRYSYSDVKELSDKLYMLPAKDIVGLGTFFFKMLIDLLVGMTKEQQKPKKTKIQRMLAFLGS